MPLVNATGTALLTIVNGFRRHAEIFSDADGAV
jgi:hypothetical protein